MRTPSSRSAGRLRGQRRGRPDARPGSARRTTTLPRRTSRTPRTPRPSRRWSPRPTQRFPRSDRAWTAADTLKNVVLMVTEPDGTRTPLVVGVPGDREVDLKRLAAQLDPAAAEPFDDADFDAYPMLVKGYIGPAGSGRGLGERDPLPGRPAGGRGHPVDHRRERQRPARLRPGLRPRLHSRRHHRGGRGPGGRPGPRRLRTVATGPRHRDGPRLPARPEVRRGARTQGAGRERQARDGHHGLVRGRASRAPSPRWRRTPATTRVCAGRGSWRRSTCTSWPPARTRRCCVAATELARDLDEAGVSVLLDDRKVSPGVKFADAEILGMPTIVVVGRGLADGPDRDPGPADRRADRRRRRRGGGPDRGGRARSPGPRRHLGGRPGPRALGRRAAGAGRLRRRMGRRRGRRRRADPAAGAAHRAAAGHAAGHHPGHQQDLLGLGHRHQFDHLRDQDQTRLADRAAAGDRRRRSAPRWALSWPNCCPGSTSPRSCWWR